MVGSGKGNQVDQRIQFEGPEHMALFSMLMDQSEFGMDWDVNEGVLRAGFDELSLIELRNHLKTIHVQQPDLDNMGSFNSVELKSIPLIPGLVTMPDNGQSGNSGPISTATPGPTN